MAGNRVAFVLTVLLYFSVPVVPDFEQRHIEADLDHSHFNESSSTSGQSPAPNTITTHIDTCADFPWKDIRLPLWVTPEHYKVRIIPDVEAAIFNGSVEIELDVKEATDFFVFNMKKLNIFEIKMKNSNGKNVEIKQRIGCEAKEQTAIVVKQKMKPKDKYTLSMKFSGPLTESMEGLYSSFYKTPSGQRKYVAVTQFEPIDARTMIPCWDEPTFKAHFTVKVVRMAYQIALSNTRTVKNETLPDGTVEQTFEKTVKMSTYLLAIVVADDFERVTTKSKNGADVSVYAPNFQIKQTEYALNAAVKALDFLSEFFLVPYPLKKLDLVSLNDFAAGAMENWGLMTFRDSRVLFDPQISSTSSEAEVALTVTHEVTHQWFGNLVTMKWWNDLWLNEAFAEFFTSFTTSEVNPDWNLMSTFVAKTVAPAMYLDGLVRTHSVAQPIKEPSQIAAAFDFITYKKGASLLRMLIGLVGREKMQKTMQTYMNKYKFSNAEGKDLWNIVDNITHKDVGDAPSPNIADFMTNFTDQPGYPVVQVKNEAGKLTLIQSRFFYLNEESKKHSDNQTWHIPLTLTTDNGQNLTKWMQKKKKVEVDIDEGAKWYKINLDNCGFYRVNYDNANWKALFKQLIDKPSVFSAQDRTGLIIDALAFLQTGALDLPTFFSFFPYLEKETALGPFQAIVQVADFLDSVLQGSDSYPAYKKFMKTTMANSRWYQKIGWTPKSGHEAKLIQSAVLGLSCRYDVSDCRFRAKSLFQNYLKDKTRKISPDQRSLMCAEAVRTDSSVWDAVFELYKGTNVPSEKIDFLQCLTATSNSSTISSLLQMTLDSNVIRPNLMFVVLEGVASNNKTLALEFVIENFESIKKILGHFSLPKLVESLHVLNKQADYDELVSVFKNTNFGSSQASYERTLEGIRMNIQFMKLNEAKIKIHLQHVNSGGRIQP